MQKNFSAPDLLSKLKDKIEKEELSSLNLPPYARVLLPSALPSQKEFEDEENVAFQILDKAHLEKFSGISIKTDKKLVFFTWVIPAGLGDLGMQIHISETIASMNPNLNIELVTIMDERSPLPDGLRSTLPHHIIMYKHPEPAIFTPKIEKLLREAFCIIDIPTDYFDFLNVKEKILKDNPSPPIISRIAQYGYVETSSYNPSTNNRSMGLHPLEKGVLSLPKVPPQKRSKNTYFAYLITKEGITTYFLSILLNRKKDGEDLTIIVPNLGKVLPILASINFTGHGIKEVIIEDDPEISHLPCSPTGKTLTIKHKKNISPKIIIDLMATSNPFVGIRGDGSFTECLCTDAIFFYDALDHALPFLTDLADIAYSKLMPYFSLNEYLPLLHQKTLPSITRAAKISEVLDDPSFVAGFDKLRILLHENYALNENLINLIKQNWAFYNDRELESRENHRLKEFLAGKIPLLDYLRRS